MFDSLIQWAQESQARDPSNQRAEFIELARKAQALAL